MEIFTLSNSARIVYNNPHCRADPAEVWMSSVLEKHLTPTDPLVSNKVPVITITCHFISSSVLSLHAGSMNNAGVMNKTCLEIQTCSCFVQQLASFHNQCFIYFLILQLMRLVFYISDSALSASSSYLCDCVHADAPTHCLPL